MTHLDTFRDETSYLEKMTERAEFAKSAGLEIGQAHGPYLPFFDDDEKVANMAKTQAVALRTASALKIPYIVFHPCVFPWCIEDVRREEALEKNFEWFSNYIPTLLNTETMAVIENCYLDDLVTDRTLATCCSNAQDLKKLVGELNLKAGKTVFGVNFDTGHANDVGEVPYKMAEELGSLIKSLHVHDNDALNDYHMTPFATSGSIDWIKLLEVLAKIDYKGTLNFEHDAPLERNVKEVTPLSLEVIATVGREMSEMFERNKQCLK
jgi:sugar phosphate isomerase/epimerase